MASTWIYAFSTSVAEPPSSGQLRFNTDIPYADVTKLWLRYISGDGLDLFYALRALPVDARLVVQDKNDHTKFVEFRVVSTPLDKATYFEVPVVWVQGGDVALNGGQDVAILSLSGSDVLPPEPPTPGPPGTLTQYAGSWVSHVFSVLVIPPVVEPLTLAEAKLLAGLNWPDGDVRDGQMRDFIASARSKVEQDTGLALLTQTRDLFYDGGPLYGEPVLLVAAQCRPLQSITSIDPIDPTTGLPTPVLALPQPLAIQPWPTFVAGQALRVRLVAGWPDVATLRAGAPLLLHAVGLLVAHYATIGRDLTTVGTIITTTPQGYDDALVTYIPAMVP